MKILFIASIFATVSMLWITPTYAIDYTLKRVTITWDNGSIEDSFVDEFAVEGTMHLNNGAFTQEIIFCVAGTCEVVVDDTGSVISVGINDANVTLRSFDGAITELTLLSLNPNLITMFVYSDGAVETHEWEIADTITAIRNNLPENHTRKHSGYIGSGVASALRPDARK
tara:strand:- start:1020 stop:1529 length:510 start_codon:yes stop_codon:yes gene_type:complete